MVFYISWVMTITTKKLSELANIFYGASPAAIRVENSDIPIFGTSGLIGYASEPLFKTEAIVVGRKGTLGNPIYTPGNFWTIDTTYAVITKEKIHTKWLYYALLHHDLTRLNEATGVPSINRDRLYDVEITYFEYAEQRIIADILSTLDEAIDHSESLVRKHQSLKQGLMSDLLTRGVDKNGEIRNPETHTFKNSEIGQIPVDWKIATLGQVTSTATDGPFGSNLKTEHYRQDGVRVVRLQNIGEGTFDDTDKAFVSKEHANRLSKFEVRSGDLLIAAMGDENHPILRACLYPPDFQEGIVKADCFRFRLNPKRAINPYVMWILACSDTRSDLRKLSQGVTRDRINLKNTQTVRLRLPSVEEQERIVNILDAQQVLLYNEKTQLDKLKLLKQGLMQDLLSGQVRVKV
jgi:type I restriction enzyme S subunit